MVVKVDDTVLAYHGVMIYDAKVLKVDHGNGVQSDKSAAAAKGTSASMYYVHYQGWHKKWDEWIAHDRVLEDTPANRALQRAAKTDHDAKRKDKSAMARKKKISASGIEAGAAKKSPFKRMKRNADNDTEEMPEPLDAAMDGSAPGAKQLAIQMPFSLKKQLVEDWKHVTHEPYRLVPLPRKPTVSQIIKNYLEFKKSKLKDGVAADDKEYKVRRRLSLVVEMQWKCVGGQDDYAYAPHAAYGGQNLEGIMEGIQAYFDRALGSILLYRMERKQYNDVKQKHPDTLLSEIYGAEHLVRLFGASLLGGWWFCCSHSLTRLSNVVSLHSPSPDPLGRCEPTGTRDPVDSEPAQRLSQVHPEELGHVVPLRVRARDGQVRGAGAEPQEQRHRFRRSVGLVLKSPPLLRNFIQSFAKPTRQRKEERGEGLASR